MEKLILSERYANFQKISEPDNQKEQNWGKNAPAGLVYVVECGKKCYNEEIRSYQIAQVKFGPVRRFLTKLKKMRICNFSNISRISKQKTSMKTTSNSKNILLLQDLFKKNVLHTFLDLKVGIC